MFTGIVTTTGRITKLDPLEKGMRLTATPQSVAASWAF